MSEHWDLLTCVAITGFYLMVLDRAVLMNFQVALFFSPFQISDANSGFQSENLPNASSVQLSTDLHVSEETSG